MLPYLDTVIAFSAIMLGVSILVTALTQVINAILGLRGKSLLWGLETLLVYIDPDFKEQVRRIVEKILRHPLLSHTGGRRATAIRREEFIALLEDTVSQEQFAGGITAVENQRRQKIETMAATERFQFKAPAEYLDKVEKWFDHVMDRVSERFALRARWASIGFAVMLTAVFHLDAIALLDKFFSDAELRANLVRSTEVLLDRADEVFAASSSAYTEAVIRLKAASEDGPKLGVPPEFFSAAAARDWIRAQISDSARAEILIGEYNKILDAVLREKIGRLVNVADSIRVDFDRARFTLIPKPYPQWPYGWREIIGMIASIVLLSLGASFWYNVLKTLANLRPRVAEIIGREKRPPKPAEG
jgi:hypothetical protein